MQDEIKTQKARKKTPVSQPADRQGVIPKKPTPSTPASPKLPFPNAEYLWGAWWRPDQNMLVRHLYGFRYGLEGMPKTLGREEHFKAIVSMLWGPTNRKKKFVWHPWAEAMLEAACNEMKKDKGFLAVAGAASSGKSEWAAVWAIVSFLCLPEKTMVLVTSTSLKDARRRVWGAIRDYWTAIPGRAPGKLVDSAGLIRYDLGTKDSQTSDRSGIALIASEKSKEKEAYAKLIGFKNDRVILLADELSEISESVVGAAYSNLAMNPFFQMIGLSNPNSYYDAFGVFAKPKAGWASINAESQEWETARGRCIRLDGLKSPNVLAGKTLYPWLLTQEFLDQQREVLGENSNAFWRMIRAYWSPTGVSDGVYSEADIVRFKADTPAVWLRPPTPIAALDPAFTNGGDRSVLYFGKFGENTDGLKCVEFVRCLSLQEDVTDTVNPRSFQIVKQFRDLCTSEGVLPENAAFDASGAGKPFGDIVAREWSPKVLRVDFGGKASTLPASVSDTTPSDERYVNRVSEIWFGAKELMRTSQIRGVSVSLAKELCARTYTTEKTSSMRLRVEPKPDMKARIGKSPDEADAALMLVALCREKYGFGADRATERGVSATQYLPFKEQFRRLNFAMAPRTLTRV